MINTMEHPNELEKLENKEVEILLRKGGVYYHTPLLTLLSAQEKCIITGYHS